MALMGKCLADMPILTLTFQLGSIICSTRELYVPATPAKPHHPHHPQGKIAYDVLTDSRLHNCGPRSGQLQSVRAAET